MPHPPLTSVDEATFRKAVEPFSTMLREMAKAGYMATRAVTPESAPKLAAVGSTALDELAVHGRYAGEWDATPIETATSHVALLLTAGEDSMLTYADAIVAERTPIYAYVPIARSGLECLALAHWLADPAIEVRERVRRSLNERIESAYEQRSLPDELNPEPGRMGRLRRAAKLGYELTPSKKARKRYFASERPNVPARPNITQQVKRVLGHDRLGKVLYSYTSAISHGTLWGLTERIEIAEEAPGPLLQGAITVTSAGIGSLAAALVMGHSRAFGAYVAYMGWEVDAWRAAQQRAMRVIGSFIGQRAAPPEVEPEWELATPGGVWLPEHAGEPRQVGHTRGPEHRLPASEGLR